MSTYTRNCFLAEFVVADLTLDNSNAWFEICGRHALRAAGAVLTYAFHERLPFDIAGRRMVCCTLARGQLSPELVQAERGYTGCVARTTGEPCLSTAAEPQRAGLKDAQSRRCHRAQARVLEACQGRVEVARRKRVPPTFWSSRASTTHAGPHRRCARHRGEITKRRIRLCRGFSRCARRLLPGD